MRGLQDYFYSISTGLYDVNALRKMDFRGAALCRKAFHQDARQGVNLDEALRVFHDDAAVCCFDALCRRDFTNGCR